MSSTSRAQTGYVAINSRGQYLHLRARITHGHSTHYVAEWGPLDNAHIFKRPDFKNYIIEKADDSSAAHWLPATSEELRTVTLQVQP